MVRQHKISLLTAIVCLLASCAQMREPAVMLPHDGPSVVVNGDSTISFRYCGKAKRVTLMGDFLYEDQDSTRYNDYNYHIRMYKENDSCFQMTTKPLYPDVYTYCFKVDGKRVPDPLNNDTSWQRLHKWNIIAVGGKPLANLYLPPKHEGRLVRTKWHSSAENIYRRVNIYTPACYDTCSKPLDVVYLIHGINGYEGAWTERGRAIQTLENLVAQGRCKPVILVMPDLNSGAHEDVPSFHTLFNSLTHYTRQRRDKDLELSVNDLIAMIDSTYNVSGNFAIAGLSDGARIAADVAKKYPDRVTAVGMFCPVTRKTQLPPAGTKAKYFVFVGKRDLFYNNGKRFHKRMEKAGVPHMYREFGGRHDWRTWREHLVLFLENK